MQAFGDSSNLSRACNKICTIEKFPKCSISFFYISLLGNAKRDIVRGEAVRKGIMLSIVAIALISSLVALANAAGYTYELTSNYPEYNVPLDTAVTVTAKTNDPNAYRVRFIWSDPAGRIELTEGVTVTSDGGFSVASSTCTLNTIGDWDVYAIFLDKFGSQCFSIVLPVKIRYTSFNVIPEVAVIGTAGASVAMIAAFTYKMKRKPKNIAVSI